MESCRFTVIIVGGSIAGLTLAHCLERAGIDHIVLEKGTHVAPQVGASIGVLPNGARILDQLDIYREIEHHIEPLETATVCYPDGFSFSSSYPKLIYERFGYPIAFLDRQKVLDILFRSYSGSKSIHLKAEVKGVETSSDGVIITTTDGARYHGHLVVGADGVHSTIRSEIWKTAPVVTEVEKKSMTVEYSCIFGISSPIPGLHAGHQVNAFFDRRTIVTIQGKGGRIYWFVIQKLQRKYIYPNSPRFTSSDAAAAAERLRDVLIYRDVTFGALWDRCETASMTALEENVFRTWHHGRMVLIGDSAHKMTPNIGQGANVAIEDAAALASLLSSLRKCDVPSYSEIESVLQQYQRARYNRVCSVYSMSRFLVRLQARDGLLYTMFGRYYAPYAGDLPADVASETIASGEIRGLTILGPPKDRWRQYHASRGNRVAWLGPVLVLVLSLLFSRYGR
ncbi:FAD-dependent oxidoreductase [Aspergillus novofumigatus IBT 16806]|uniref:FAD/NAD(P)-binding domain-containing protein n=1 Tax=Aspergillus novofumigatus (strain IBT 16806) TaxID=1392255 RepID=A0A2I1BYM0_ASPN1|nr:FAD/NAD(P)-binding domain-containing protein [Aspergillus novofumigatus IBT 16806]PKX90478.1 FAD/NAD(P)-binding domain-containing protein [Aspergillus novofumigatus IBT 16806]